MNHAVKRARKDKEDSFGPRTVSSGRPVDVLIPAIRKDLPILPLTVRSVRKFLRHPIGKIFVVGPKTEDLVRFCRDNGCEFRDEDAVLPVRLKDIRYSARGTDRSGWIFQQLIKLNSDAVSGERFVYTIDADTILSQPQKFETGGKTILLLSDEHHQPYYAAFERLFGYPVQSPSSFVAHQMLFDVDCLKDIRQELESTHLGRSWYEIILSNLDKDELSSFSEFETYGNWMIRHYQEDVATRYWHNLRLGKLFLPLLPVVSCFLPRIRSVSFHSYLKMKSDCGASYTFR